MAGARQLTVKVDARTAPESVTAAKPQAVSISAPDRAATLARFSISALEGALIQCRVSGDELPLVEAAVELKALFEAARAGRSGFV